MVMNARQWTVLEFIEFSGPNEFRKFNRLPDVTDEDIAECDFEKLVLSLQGESNARFDD